MNCRNNDWLFKDILLLSSINKELIIKNKIIRDDIIESIVAKKLSCVFLKLRLINTIEIKIINNKNNKKLKLSSLLVISGIPFMIPI